MPLDALCLSAVLAELKTAIVGARVDKIQQPEKDVFLFSLRAADNGGNVRLLLSAGVGSARMNLTSVSRENPNTPPMLCMLLRKHLTGARIKEIRQPDMERLYDIAFAAYDEMGIGTEKRLVLEMLGRSSNLILIDGEGRILDCLRKTDSEDGEKRRLLPGLFYSYPPRPDKPSVFDLTEDELIGAFSSAQPDTQADKWLVSGFSGVSPLLARELIFSVSGSIDTHVGLLDSARLYRELCGLRERKFTPVMLKDANTQKPFDIYCFPLRQYGTMFEAVAYGSFSELLDSFFTEREMHERLSQRGQTLIKTVKNRRDRAAKKLSLRLQELKNTEDRERLRQKGDLIKANIYRMSKGQTVLLAEDFYSENAGLVEIPLEARLSPQQNAEKYYKAYNKAKNAGKILHGQIEEAQTELDYLESVLEEIERAAGEKDLDEIRQELIAEGYIREKSGSAKKKPAASQPLRFVSSKGAEILVGRNNVQNERLTLKFAGKNDIWLHTQKTHGSHVIAYCDENDYETLKEAAQLAAYYSKARNGSNVPVDYTRVRHVKKPSGGKTGMVIYTDYKTIFVTPDAEIVKSLNSSGAHTNTLKRKDEGR